MVLEPAIAGIEQLEQEVLALFPAPGPAERVWLIEALLGVREDVTWLQGHFGGGSELQLLPDLLELWQSQVPPEQRQLQRQTLSGDHDAAGIMVGDHKRTQPLGLQVLRGLLWLVLRQKRRLNQPSSSAVHDLAAALRAARTPTTPAAEALGSILPALGRATSVEQAIEALSPLATTQHKSLSKLWKGWLRPALEAPAAGQPERQSPPPSVDPPRRPSFRRRRERVPADVEEERLETTDGPLVRRLVRSRPFDGQMPHEPAEEFGESAFHVTVPGKGEGLPESLVRFYAQRAIWAGNSHLLTNHVDALLPDVLGLVLRSLVDLLQRVPAAGPVALGAAGCLLKALTGRTTAGLQAFNVGTSGHVGPIAGGILDIDVGLFWISVFWKADVEDDQVEGAIRLARPAMAHFRPTVAQRKFLAPVSDRLALPMPKPVRDVLRSHRSTLEALATTDAEVLDRAMSTVLGDIRNEVAVPVTVGGLRRSLGPLVMEHCGDPAMAQLICGESLGLTMAPLSYFAPKMKRVAEVYRAALSEQFGLSPLWRIPAQATRVGSELMVTLDTARRLAASSARRTPQGPPGQSEQMALMMAHRRIADHLTRMVVGTTGHRPSEALFEIRLSDIDLDSGAALVRDKRHDEAHDPRLACIPRVVVGQIQAYLRHIHHLRHRIRSPSISDELTKVLLGSRPLLFDINEAGEMIRPKLAQVVARSPDDWNELPWNWSRTWIRTSAVESGASAFLIAAQLGHFDSIGYPYSNQSPTEPVDVLRRTQPWLDQLAKRLGWSVVESDLAVDAAAAADVDLPALRDWGPDIGRAREMARASHRQWEQRLNVDRHKLRTESLAKVLNHPALVETGLATADADPTHPVLAEVIESLDVDTIRDDLVVACSDDAIAASARVRALKEVLHRLAKRAGVPVPPLPVPVAVRRPLDNPFFQGACLALTQTTAMRRHVQVRSRQRSPRRTLALQVARTAEALTIFGGVDDVSTVRAVLEARSKATPSAKIVDLLLVPVSEGRCVALRGIAALALAALASEVPDEPLPDDAEIEAALSTLLPAWAVDKVASQPSLLARLCSTVAVANRFEYSPAARFALDPELGSVQASLEEQIAFIDADPIGPLRPSPPVVATVGASDPVACTDKPDRKTTARRQYSSLIALIPKPGKALMLPLTRITIPATSIQTERTRDQVIAELRAWLGPVHERGDLWPIVRMLGEWLLAEAERRRASGRRLADRTVATYLTRIGSALVRVLGELELTQWDERTLEDAYAYALEASRDAKHKVASALLSFHHFCDTRFDLPDADLGDVYAALGTRKRRVDAAMILPVERNEALSRLREKAWEVPADDLACRRARLAEFVGIFLGRTGARVSEPLGIRVADVGLRPSGDVVTIIRSNRMRQLKTQAGRRSIVFEVAAQGDRELVWAWRESVRRHAPPGRAGAAYLTAEIDNSRAFGEHGVISALIRSELAQATGRPSERLHRLRHLKAQEAITAVALSAKDARALDLQPFAEDRALQPRDFAAISVPLGHSHWMTTLQWYVHLPCVLQSQAASRLAKDYFGRQAVAGALGYTPAFFDNLLREGAALSPEAAWFNRFRPARVLPQARDPKSVSVHSTWQWTARRVANLLTEAGRCKDLESAVRLSGAPLEAVSALTRCAGRWERKLGRRLLPEFAAGARRVAPRKALRRLERDSAIEVLWDRFDHGDVSSRHAILRVVDAMFAELLPGTGETLTIPPTEALRLQQLLIVEGIPEADIRIDVDTYDMARVSVQRAASPSTGGMSALYGLRRVLAVIGLAAMIQEPD